MKRLIALLSLISCLPTFGATWTFHGCKDNYSDAVFWSSDTQSCQWWLRWDYAWDLAKPSQVDSGVSQDGYISPTGYSDVLTFDVPEGYFLYGLDISSRYITSTDDYSNGYQSFGWVFNYDTMAPQPYVSLDGGEYWIDFASDGTARISTTQPTDFGKWSWDGSINPSWVEPLVVKGKKGHRK